MKTNDSECKNLIGKMLMTDPKQRATLSDIMNHPWMVKGFNGPPDNHLPHREPLQLPLDPVVIQKMTGFDFGPPEFITRELTKVIDSEEYQRAVRAAARRQHVHPVEHTNHSRGILAFYKRRNSANSRDTLTNPSAEVIPLGQDPTNAFSPLISIYYLVREKIERERREIAPGATAIPGVANEPTIPMPDLPAPPAAVTNAAAPEMMGESTGGRARPRARTRGEDELAASAMGEKAHAPDSNKPAVTFPDLPAETPKKESVGAIFRRISTRRKPRTEPASTDVVPIPEKANAPALSVTRPAEQPDLEKQPGIPRKSYSTRRPNRIDETSSASLNAAPNEPKASDSLHSPAANATGFTAAGLAPRRFMSLRRAASVDRRKLKRNAADGYGEAPPTTSGSDGTGVKKAAEAPERPKPEDTSIPPVPTLSGATPQRMMSLGHARRESIQARRAKKERQQDVKEETDAELVAAAGGKDSARNGGAARRDHSDQGADSGGEGGEGESLKPVYLKGLFSVSTTSTKKISFIRADIIRVLTQLNLEYREIKGGFLCSHRPSIAPAGASSFSTAPVASTTTPAPPAALQSSTGSTGLDKPHTRKPSLSALINLAAGKEHRHNEPGVRSPKTPKRSDLHGSNSSPTGPSDTESDSGANPMYNRKGTRDAAGVTSTHVMDEMNSSSALEFEIFIVKVPFLSLHGIQFKKVEGNIMLYKEMAQEILERLKL
jgi:hypothetical protein